MNPGEAYAVHETTRADLYQAKRDSAERLKVWWVDEGYPGRYATLRESQIEEQVARKYENATGVQAELVTGGDRGTGQTDLPQDVVETLGKLQEITQMMKTHKISSVIGNGRPQRCCDASCATAEGRPRSYCNRCVKESSAETLGGEPGRDAMATQLESVKPKKGRSPLGESIPEDVAALPRIERRVTPLQAENINGHDLDPRGAASDMPFDYDGQVLPKDLYVVEMRDVEAICAENQDLNLENGVQQIEIDLLKEQLHRAQADAYSFICAESLKHDRVLAPLCTAATSAQTGLHSQDVVPNLRGGDDEEVAQKDGDSHGRSQNGSGDAQCEAEFYDDDESTLSATFSTMFDLQGEMIAIRQALETRVSRPTTRTVKEDNPNAAADPSVTLQRERNNREESGNRACEATLRHERRWFEDGEHNLWAELSAKRAESSSRLEVIHHQEEIIDRSNQETGTLQTHVAHQGKTIERQDDDINRLNRFVKRLIRDFEYLRLRLEQERDEHARVIIERDTLIHNCRCKPEPRFVAREKVVETQTSAAAPPFSQPQGRPSTKDEEPEVKLERNVTIKSTDRPSPASYPQDQPFNNMTWSQRVYSPTEALRIGREERLQAARSGLSVPSFREARDFHESSGIPMDQVVRWKKEELAARGTNTNRPNAGAVPTQEQVQQEHPPRLPDSSTEEPSFKTIDAIFGGSLPAHRLACRKAVSKGRDYVLLTDLQAAMAELGERQPSQQDLQARYAAQPSARPYLAQKTASVFKTGGQSTLRPNKNEVEHFRNDTNCSPFAQEQRVSPVTPSDYTARANLDPQDGLGSPSTPELNPSGGAHSPGYDDWVNGYGKCPHLSFGEGAYYPSEESEGSITLSLRGGGGIDNDWQEQLADSVLNQRPQTRHRVRNRERQRDWSRTTIHEQFGMTDTFIAIAEGRPTGLSSIVGAKRDEKRAVRKPQQQGCEEESRRPSEMDVADLVNAGPDSF